MGLTKVHAKLLARALELDLTQIDRHAPLAAWWTEITGHRYAIMGGNDGVFSFPGVFFQTRIRQCFERC